MSRPRATRRRAAGLALAALMAVLGCARRAPPSGGPPDLVPPRVIASTPESAAARVPIDAALSVTFSKSMEPRTTGDAVALAPRIDITRRRWHGRTLSVELATPLTKGHTYTLFVGPSARDSHGNGLDRGAAITFSTADSFPPGVIEGEIQALGFAAPGTWIWVYGNGRAPDSTARDFDALGLTDENSHFRVAGLPVPGRYRIWAFADLNRNRSFEPLTDVLAPGDTTFELSAASPRAGGSLLRMTNPRAPGRIRGAVIDSTGDTLGVVRVVAISGADSTRRMATDADTQGHFDFNRLPAGVWLLRAWRDDDRNHAWRVDLEPASELVRVELRPAGDVADITLRLRRRGGP